jgi:hypothetical protein
VYPSPTTPRPINFSPPGQCVLVIGPSLARALDQIPTKVSEIGLRPDVLIGGDRGYVATWSTGVHRKGRLGPRELVRAASYTLFSLLAQARCAVGPQAFENG